MITQGDLKIGMHLTNDGTGNILVYDNLDATGSPMLTVKPGQYIGQIVDLRQGQGGLVIDLISDDITKAAPIAERVYVWILDWLPFYQEWVAGGVRFANLQQNVSDNQIAEQKQAMAIAENNGVSLVNSIKKVASGISDVAFAAVPWGLVLTGLTVWVVFTNPGIIGEGVKKVKSIKWKK